MRSSNKLIFDVSDIQSSVAESMKNLNIKVGDAFTDMKDLTTINADSILNKSVLDGTNRLQGILKCPLYK